MAFERNGAKANVSEITQERWSINVTHTNKIFEFEMKPVTAAMIVVTAGARRCMSTNVRNQPR